MTKRHKPRQNGTKNKAGKIIQKNASKSTKGKTPTGKAWIKHPKKDDGISSKRKEKSKLVSKGKNVHSRGTRKQLPRYSGTKTKTKNVRVNRTNTKGTKEIRKVSRSYGRKNDENADIIDRLNDQAISASEAYGKKAAFSDVKKIQNEKHFRVNKFGKRIKEKNLNAYRTAYNIKLGKGRFEDKINEIRNANLSFLDDGLRKNRPIKGKGPKMPRAVVIKIHTKHGNKNYYSGGISDADFNVTKDNIKKLILERMIDYQDNWLERVNEEGEEYLESSGKSFAPKNIQGFSITFVY